MKELIFGIIGGTALLMYGVNMMGSGLENISGKVMKRMMSIFTRNVFTSFLVGIGLTALVQSSTAVTMLTVGFVNAGLMPLSSAVGVIYGANIGTTVTAQLLAFSFKFKLTDLALPILGVGFAVSSFTKNKTQKSLGEALMGFGMMFLGLKTLNAGIPFLQGSETLKYFFAHYASNPLIGIALGLFATALVHSSAATVGLVIVLGEAGLIDLSTAIFLMMGDNIGTCITAQLASMQGNINARRTAWAHTLYNVTGVLVMLLIFPVFRTVVISVTSALQHTTSLPVQIANSHTLFNCTAALIFLPMTKYYVRFLEARIKPKEKRDSEDHALNTILLDTPVMALEAVKREIIRGVGIADEMRERLLSLVVHQSLEEEDKINELEEKMNKLHKNVTKYMVDLSKRPMRGFESLTVSAMITCVNNIERLCDHVVDIVIVYGRVRNTGATFSEDALSEIEILNDVQRQMFAKTLMMLNEGTGDRNEMEALEQQVDDLCKQMANEHIKRLEQNKCNIEAGIYYTDLVNHYERIGDIILKVFLTGSDELQGIDRQVAAEAARETAVETN